MNNQKIENMLLLFILIRGIFLLFCSHLNISEIIISGVIALVFIIVLEKINIKKTKIFSLIFLFILLITSIITLPTITLFITNNIAKNFTNILIGITILIIALYICFLGYHAYIKTVELSSYLLFIYIVFSIIFAIFYVKFDNLSYLTQPTIFLDFQYSNIIKFSFFLVIIYLSLNYLNNYTINIKCYFLSMIHIIFIKLLIISILGLTLEKIFRYPYINIFKKVSLFNFFERLESLFALQFLFDYFFIFILFLLAIKSILQNFFPKKNSY